MIRKLEHDEIAADLAAVDTILQTIPEDDVLGRVGFEERRDELAHSLFELETIPETYAGTAIMFAGDPVKGALGIRSDFAGSALERYQDMVAKVLAQRERGNLGTRGVVPHREAATLHLTNVIHGSFGFVLEELQGGPQDPLLATELKLAADETARLIASFTDEDDERFTAALVNSDPRVFDALGEFFKFMRSNGARFRLVSGNLDMIFHNRAIAIAAERAQATHLTEEEREFSGELLGVLPEGHRFELRVSPDGEIIDGAVSPDITSAHLQELYQRLSGRRSRARIRVRKIERQGKSPRVSYVLLSAEVDG
jgi:hypothetical protein